MRMIVTQNFTDNRSTFFSFSARSQMKGVHRIHDSPVNRFETITNIRQSTLNNNRHRIVDVSLFDLILNRNLYDRSTFRGFFFF